MDPVAIGKTLGEMAPATIFLVFILFLGWYIYKTTTQDRERTDVLITLVGEVQASIKINHEFVKEQHEFWKDFNQYYRDQSTKCKETILVEVQKTQRDVEDIKNTLLRSK